MLTASNDEVTLNTVQADPSQETLYGDTPTILVVEDRDEIAHNIVDVMEDAGFHTVSAASVEEAVEMLTDDDRNFDLLVSDEHLPGMEGEELAQVAHDYRPEIKVMIIRNRDAQPTGEAANDETGRPLWADEMVDQVSALL